LRRLSCDDRTRRRARTVVSAYLAPMTRRMTLVVTAASLVLWGCGDGADSSESSMGCAAGAPVDGRPLQIATTVAPITSIVANIAGGSGAVITGLVPEGVNSHTYEPSPSVAATLERAHVVFLNGLALDEPTKALAQSNIDDDAVLCELATSVLPEDQYIFDFSFPKSGGDPNPHLWTDPPMAGEYAALVHDVLVRVDPDQASVYDANLDAFQQRVEAFDRALRDATATVPAGQRLLLTYHDAYAYFAREYGWTVVGAIQPSSFDEPTPRDVARLIDQIEERDVPAVFGSEVFPSPVLEQIAAESGARYVDDLRDDDLPGDPGDAEHSWLGLMRFDYVTIVEALGGDASELRALDVSDVSPDTAGYG
jgi:ABC-type Zn uptake system ZnuABC Zn-binding protein ZnuA